MAAFDKDRLIVRVAYAGAPMAGKTESVRALLPLLKGQGAERLVMSPAEDRGRTAYFDWADYEGGAFQGKPIHCQITSVPGQVALSSRRELLVRGADAVILVVDSRSEAIERAQQCYEEMAPWLAEAGREVPVRLLLQCNKQDLPGSLTPNEIRDALGLDFGKDVYATSARTGKGLRATFVAGVRVAVERAKAQIARGLIAKTAEIASGDELLEVMQRDEAFQNLVRREPVARRAASNEAARARAPGPGARGRSTTSDVPTSSTEAVASSRDVASRPLPRTSAPLAKARAPHESSTNLRAAPSEEPVLRPSSTPPSAERTPARTPARAKAPAPPPSEPSRDVPAPRKRGRSEREEVAPEAPAASSAAARARREAAPTPRTPAKRPEPRKRISWSPDSGPRPAVLPASVYEAAMARAGRPTRQSERARPQPRRRESEQPSARARDSSAPAAARSMSPAVSAPARRASGARPAVMPSSAYLASMGKALAAAPAAGAASVELAALVSEPRRVARPTPVPRKTGARPAVVPSEAWLARRKGEGAASSAAALSPAASLPAASAPPASEDTPPTSPSRVSGAPGPVTAPEAKQRSQRPAVLPSEAWLAQRAALRSLEAGRVLATTRSSAPPSRRPSAQSSIRPAVMPPSAWEEEPGAWVAPEAAPRRMEARSRRPAVMPAAAWRASVASEFQGANPANEVERRALEANDVERRALEANDVERGALGASDVERAALERPTQVPPPPINSEPTNYSDELASGPLSSLIPLSLIPSSPSTNPPPPSPGARTPPLPGRGLSPRAVWPRHVWRILEPQITPRGRALKDARERWLGELAPGWYARTLETASDESSARRTFAGTVLRHRKLRQQLSSPRCLALTEDADRWLIWQIVYRVPTLATTLGKTLASGEPPSAIAEALVQCAQGYLDARERFVTLPEPLPLSLHALSAHEGRFVYAGLLPNAGASLSRPSGDASAALEDALRKRWSEAAPDTDVPALLEALEASATDRLPEPILEVLRKVVLR
jgi:GTPase SAR1 family protein